MESWVFWVIGALALAIAELLGAEFVLLALGVSCLGGAAVAYYTDAGIGGQLAGFAAVAIVMVPLLAVWLRRKFAPPSGYGTTGTGGECGARVVVENVGGKPYVRYRGDQFPVACAQGLPQIGETVEILEFKGITAQVRRMTDGEPGDQQRSNGANEG